MGLPLLDDVCKRHKAACGEFKAMKLICVALRCKGYALVLNSLFVVY